MASEKVAKLAERMCLEVAKSERFWRDLGPEPWAAVLLGAVLMGGLLFLLWVFFRHRAEIRRFDLELKTLRCVRCAGTGRVPFGASDA